MSDEREADGAAGDGDGTTNGSGRTAVATPLRPTGKRARIAEPVEAEPIEKAGESKNGRKKKVKTAKKSGPSRNPIVFIWTFLKQVVAELRKVIWPNRKQMVSYTAVVLVFLVFMVTLIGVVDLGLVALVRGVFAGEWKF